jgi:hypothetical protein
MVSRQIVQQKWDNHMTGEQLKTMADLVTSPAAYGIRLSGVAAIVGAERAEEIIDGVDRIVMRQWRAVGATAGRRLVEEYLTAEISVLN